MTFGAAARPDGADVSAVDTPISTAAPGRRLILGPAAVPVSSHSHITTRFFRC
jgi:hypothetical protein